MVSTSEEFLLLLKKWRDEATQVSVVSVLNEADVESRVVFHISGYIEMLDEEKALLIVADENHNVAYVTFSNCKFLYESSDTQAEGWTKILANLRVLTGSDYEELAMLVTPSKVKVAIYSQTLATLSEDTTG